DDYQQYEEVDGLAEALEKLASSEDYRIVEVTQDNCPECVASNRLMGPFLLKSGVQVTEWNVSARGRWRKSARVTATPTWILLKDDKEVDRVEGNRPEMIEAMVNRVQSSLPKAIPVPAINVLNFVPS